MSRVTQKIRNFAWRLANYERRGNKSSGAKPLAGIHVCEKLCLHLTPFMGDTGFHTLLSRSLALASVQIPCLRTVRVNAEGALEGLEEVQREVGPKVVFEIGVILLAQTLGLLVAFIGEKLTLGLVREVWPKFPHHGLDFSIGGKSK